MAGAVSLTFLDIINEALGHLGVYTGDPLDAADLQSAFFTLRAIIDGYGAEALTIQQIVTLPFTTSAGKSSYLLGPAGATPANDWITPSLPPDFVNITQTLTGGVEVNLDVLTALAWSARTPLKSLTSNVLSRVWPDYGPAAHTLNLFPVPNASLAVNLYVPQIIAKPTAVANQVVFAPGYQEMLTFELVIKASSKFGAPIPAWIPDAYTDAKFKVKASNFQPLDQVCDAALLADPQGTSGGGSINFYLGR